MCVGVKHSMTGADNELTPILGCLSPSVLETALGLSGLPGPRVAPPAGSAFRSASDPAATPLHGTGAGSALDRAGRKGKRCPRCRAFPAVALTLAAGGGGS